MALWAIGDLQGCRSEFDALLKAIAFNADRDRLWLTGDLVNRGPRSLDTLRRVHELRDNLVTVLGNHDLHLLALAHVPGARLRKHDTLAEILAAPDRGRLLDWLIQQPLAHHDPQRNALLVHAGLVPQWNAAQALVLAAEVQRALLLDPAALLEGMYGNEPEYWTDSLRGMERLRFIINALVRLRVCSADGRINLKFKGPPQQVSPPWLPWFDVPARASAGTRVVVGHWSALGLQRRADLLTLDTGCVWGGKLTAVDMDDEQRAPVSVPGNGATS